MITYALLSRGGAFGKGKGGGALAYCTPMQTNRLTDRLESSRTQRSMRIETMIGFRFGSVQASRCVLNEFLTKSILQSLGPVYYMTVLRSLCYLHVLHRT